MNKKADVWDITVPSVGCFSLANGAVVHNCDAIRYLAVAKNTFKEMQKAEHEKNFRENRNRGIMWEMGSSPYSP